MKRLLIIIGFALLAVACDDQNCGQQVIQMYWADGTVSNMTITVCQ